MTKKFDKTMGDVCVELTLRGIEYEISKVCNFELWIKDRYIITVMNDGKIIVGDLNEHLDRRMIWNGDWVKFFEQVGLVNKLYGRKFE